MVEKRRQEQKHIDAIADAWRTATFATAAFYGKLSPLDVLIANVTRSYEHLSAGQQLARVEALGAHLGLSLKPMSESTKRALLKLRES